MEGTTVLGRLTWQVADVTGVVAETPRVKTIAFDVPGWTGHRAGQHVDVRLTAEDGYQAQRSYSIASAPDGTRVELTVVRIGDGEVSPYLTGQLQPGGQIELRGPVGGYFVWEPPDGGPLLLVAGGSGVAPLMAMIRLRAHAGSEVDTRLLLSSRDWDDIIYRDELQRLQRRPPHRRAHTDRVTAARLGGLCAPRQRRHAGRGRPGPRTTATHLRLRPDAVRRGCGRGAGGPGASAATNQDREVRADGKLTWTN